MLGAIGGRCGRHTVVGLDGRRSGLVYRRERHHKHTGSASGAVDLDSMRGRCIGIARYAGTVICLMLGIINPDAEWTE